MSRELRAQERVALNMGTLFRRKARWYAAQWDETPYVGAKTVNELRRWGLLRDAPMGTVEISDRGRLALQQGLVEPE